MYLWQAENCDDLRIIDCVDEKGDMHAPKIIFNKILNLLK
jgi:hypothetical protein